MLMSEDIAKYKIENIKREIDFIKKEISEVENRKGSGQVTSEGEKAVLLKIILSSLNNQLNEVDDEKIEMLHGRKLAILKAMTKSVENKSVQLDQEEDLYNQYTKYNTKILTLLNAIEMIIDDNRV